MSTNDYKFVESSRPSKNETPVVEVNLYKKNESTSEKLETEAQRIANLIIKKHAKPLSTDGKKIDARYEHVDITSIENTDVKTILVPVPPVPAELADNAPLSVVV